MTAIAILGAGIALGGWIGVRYADAHNRLDADLTTYLSATIPSSGADQ